MSHSEDIESREERDKLSFLQITLNPVEEVSLRSGIVETQAVKERAVEKQVVEKQLTDEAPLPAETQPFMFLNLLPEIRFVVYRMLFRGIVTFAVVHRSRRFHYLTMALRGAPWSLLRTCRQIRAEALPYVRPEELRFQYTDVSPNLHLSSLVGVFHSITRLTMNFRSKEWGIPQYLVAALPSLRHLHFVLKTFRDVDNAYRNPHEEAYVNALHDNGSAGEIEDILNNSSNMFPMKASPLGVLVLLQPKTGLQSRELTATVEVWDVVYRMPRSSRSDSYVILHLVQWNIDLRSPLACGVRRVSDNAIGDSMDEKGLKEVARRLGTQLSAPPRRRRSIKISDESATT